MKFLGYLIAFAAGVGLALAIAAPWMIEKEIEPGDWLSFAGAMLGVGLAVIGAILVERINEWWRVRSDEALISSALKHLLEINQSISSSLSDSEEDPNLLDRSIAIIECRQFLQAAEALDFAINSVRIRDLNVWNALRLTKERVAVASSCAEDAIENLWFAPNDEVAQFIEKMGGHCFHIHLAASLTVQELED